MGRMHAPGKGISSSALPYRRTVPSWQKSTSEEIKDLIYKLAKKGYKPSLIGINLRDTHGVGKSHYLTGSKILRVLKSLGVAPDLPEDLYFMIKKAVGMRKHLERNRKDRDGKFRLILIESRIHRLSRYYRKKGVIPPNFKYDSATASALVA
jgi:small subunit ribosomal protein S13e